MIKQIFKPIPSIEGYTISEYGELIRLQNFVSQKNWVGNVVVRDRKQFIVKARISNKGYLRAAICFGGANRKDYMVHRLVAMAFIPNPQGLLQINHKDGNKLNNHYSNLEWCTASHNVQHAVDNGLLIAKKSWEDTSSKPVCLLHQGKLIWVFGSIGEAGKLTGVKRSTISKNCRSEKVIGAHSKAHGYKFSFYDSN